MVVNEPLLLVHENEGPVGADCRARGRSGGAWAAVVPPLEIPGEVVGLGARVDDPPGLQVRPHGGASQTTPHSRPPTPGEGEI